MPALYDVRSLSGCSDLISLVDNVLADQTRLTYFGFVLTLDVLSS